MKAVVGLLFVLLEVSHAAEKYCDARQKGAQCYGVLGGTVAFKLMDETSEKHRFNLKKEASVTNESTEIILSVISNMLISNAMSSRSVFILNNGTFKINNLSRSDSAPVSSVRLISNCVAQGLLKVSCLCEGGDRPEYSWILNGQPTRDTEVLRRNPANNIIILKQNMSGYLTCSVWNNINRVSEEGRISLCEDKTDETQCNIQEDEAKCYGALGGTVVIQLMSNTSQTPRYEWKNKTTTILRGRWDKFAPNDTEGRNIFIPLYGTFSIMNLSRADSGNYTLETFDSNGRKIEKRNLQLIVEAPVSSIKIVSECLSQGQMKVSCQSETGDSLQYNWTLDGRTLTDSELFSENNETEVIVLRQNISGRLVCSVWNRFSSLSTEKTISTCGFIFINCTYNGTQISEWVLAEGNTLCVEAEEYSVDDFLVVLVGVLLALVFLLAVGIGLICTHKKKHTFKVEKDNSEPIYAEVRIVAQQERQTEESVEEEVEVKQVTLSELPLQSEVAAVAPIYAQVRKVR
ncbi:uncharacterized protein LOC122837618 isoform X2 [Gambusia affinis]|uniref:uncharacterized protein LOC122837618 isoform X2 n=1 Tax=Gambusia affinis TaxID=33528 RepID=UPI001CDCDF04|nr:uncharacterized protein LOC122837618 isoform X2 [Gambusia affinis]